jgi:hypothetical protein
MRRLLRRLLVTVEEQAGEPITPARLQAEMLLDETREELLRADSKASVLLSASGIIVSALLAAALASDWNPAAIADDRAEFLFWAGIGAGAIGVGLLGLAVKPRTRHHDNRESLAYFGHVVQYSSRGIFKLRTTRQRENATGRTELKQDLQLIGGNTFQRVVDQVWTLSRIVQRKYVLISYALWVFALGITACVVALVLDYKVF